MSRGDLVEMDGILEEALGGGQYRVRIEDSGSLVRVQLCGKMKQNHIRVLPGDKVMVGVSPYDLTHGIIMRRYR